MIQIVLRMTCAESPIMLPMALLCNPCWVLESAWDKGFLFPIPPVTIFSYFVPCTNATSTKDPIVEVALIFKIIVV
jgi:hypothetical protein